MGLWSSLHLFGTSCGTSCGTRPVEECRCIALLLLLLLLAIMGQDGSISKVLTRVSYYLSSSFDTKLQAYLIGVKDHFRVEVVRL